MEEPKIIQHFQKLLNNEQITLLKEVVHQHIRYSQVHFSIVREDSEKILIKVWQNKPHNGNVFTDADLVRITKGVFARFTEKTINVKPFPFVASPPDVVTVKWINDRLTGERGEQVAMSRELGVDNATLSAYIGGLKPLSGVVRAMFYYYFNKKTEI